MRPDWVFLDRDGTLNVSPAPHEYVIRPGDLSLLPRAGAAVARLNRAGIWVGVVTNQRGVGLGTLTEPGLNAVHDRLRELLELDGAHLDGIWVCPHLGGECACRKPQPGLLLEARRAVPEIDFQRAALIGDSDTDVAAGNAVGATTIKLGSEIGAATFLATDLAAATDRLLKGG
jgi:D-glycero-D-manno-heptose 1,7-bisphosphate phosphatase